MMKDGESLTKKELRKLYMTKRHQLSELERASYASQIVQQIERNFDFSQSTGVHLFTPIVEKGEVDISPLFNFFKSQNIPVWVPKMEGQQLRSVRVDEHTVWIKSSWGISEPKDDGILGEVPVSHVVTPLLYADPKGNRIGYGKGFYDRFFAGLSQPVTKIGVGYFPPCEHIADVSSDDVPLDYLVLPTEVLSFGA